jgi:acyl transferase domain-containing protein/acyl-CoA synthetase (AMP-forming)/AMP-acid ligase II/acyl carrier protein
MSATSSSRTLVEIARERARGHGEQNAYAAVAKLGSTEARLSHAELDRRAETIAADLRRRGLRGRPVLVLCPAGLDYVASLFGCLYAGAIAVPAYPPNRFNLSRVRPRLGVTAADAGAEVALATAAVMQLWASGHGAPPDGLELVDVAELCAAGGDAALGERPGPDDAAILQYTSGSSASPKGVVLTHGQLLANLELSRASGDLSEDDVMLSWLPPFHDMGLVGGIFLSLYLGARAVLMPPESFLRRPRSWLAAATEQRATVLMAPSFAFDLCVSRIPPEDRAGLDLSSVRNAYCGAEPINPATLEAFSRAFAPYGFRRKAFHPCYGMAEATLIISGGNADKPPVMREYLAAELEQGRAAVPAAITAPSSRQPAAPSAKTRRLVGCGGPLLDERILIVDPHTLRTLESRQVGEIWVQSRSVALGYWNRPEDTQQTFHARTADTNDGPFLRTGDLGFFDDGELFVTGRLKDLIIVRGLNHYPQDIERTVQAVHSALVADAGAAFALDHEDGEQLAVVQELDNRTGVDANELLRRIPEAIREEHDITPAAMVLIKRGSMLKTSSGKVQRRAAKQAYLDGTLQVVAAWQVARAAGEPSPPATLTRPTSRSRERQIADWLRAHLAAKLKREADDLDPSEPLARYGVDSLVAAELTEELERWLGIDLPSTISYDNPTIAELARTLAQRLDDTQPNSRRVTREREAANTTRSSDPIAIVGMGCRFPGAPDLKRFWHLLRNGVDAITEVPAERWDVEALYDREPGVPGKMCSKWGGFVEGIDQFDAAFFGVSPHEAARIDPQQRLFLEVAWEALEDAGQSPTALAGSATGVFAGVCGSDYSLLYGGDLQLIDGDYGTGNAPSIVANRLSYFLDLKGPSQSIDSACSSSLVALQHACRSLRDGECELAIVGGVNAVLAPESSVYFSQLRALAKDGRCKAFDRRADGFVRSEGAGAVVLKPLSRALAEGDRVYALVAGGAVNHDGRSNGLLAPNGRAQQALLRRAHAAARISPDQLDYVEAHGVGTPVADAVELRSLGEMMSDHPRQKPLLVGSAKTNVGHLEAASGMVSLIKVALALHHQEIPPHLHLRDVHPDIDLQELGLAVPTVGEPWRRSERPRLAGASAFGFGGSNAHIVLREAPLTAPSVAEREPPRHLLTLSAKDQTALEQLAARVSHELASSLPNCLGDLCFTLQVGRAHFSHRLALTAASTEEVRAGLQRFRNAEASPQVHTGSTRAGARLRVGFAFSSAPVAPDAGLSLYQDHPRFRDALERCAQLLASELERPLLEVLYDGPAEKRAVLLARPSYSHAATLALQYAAHCLWQSWGLEPAAVYGAGAGEYGAAAATGVLGWDDALRLATRRGLVLEGLSPGAQQAVTVHQLRAELARVEYVAPTIPFLSASLGRAFGLDEVPGEAHWTRHLYREPNAEHGYSAPLMDGCDLQVQLGPSGALHVSNDASRLPTFAFDGDDWTVMLETLAVLYTRGAEIDWRTFHGPFARRKLSLPTYPFQRQRHWLDFPERSLEPAVSTTIEQPSVHPLISSIRIHVPGRSGFVRKGANKDSAAK